MISARRTVAQPRALVVTRAQLAPKIAGVAFASIFTALVWVGMLTLIGGLFGVSFAPQALAIVGCSIATFLVAVCAPLMLRATF
ncbi:MAG TPA: hypothetical protein PKD49_03225 [Hyphomicrobium sp.]|nr:hypothetical protein [Hyphomicrobium sp.]